MVPVEPYNTHLHQRAHESNQLPPPRTKQNKAKTGVDQTYLKFQLYHFITDLSAVYISFILKNLCVEVQNS